MPLADFKYGTGELLHGGEAGRLYSNVGQIYVSRAGVKGFDANLFGALKVIVDTLRVKINVNSIDTGTHSPNSRHYANRAIDSNKIARVGKADWQQQTATNPLSLDFMRLCLDSGWHIGEGGNWPGVLLGPPFTVFNPTPYDHATHLHMSIARPWARAGQMATEPDDNGPERSPCDPDDTDVPDEG